MNIENKSEKVNLGNKIYQRIYLARTTIYKQGELAQLTYNAFRDSIIKIKNDSREKIEMNYPIGYRSDKSLMSTNHFYMKEELIYTYNYLIDHQVSINGIYQLVTIIEALMGDILREVILEFPEKIGSKKMIDYNCILSASSIEEIHLQVVDLLLNELSYKSPKDFVEECKKFLAVNLWKCTPFHKYIEIKATRDIYLHNQGIANDIYIRKAYSLAREKSGKKLPINPEYFLESYEYCIQITEGLEEALHNKWPSSEFEEYHARQNQKAEQKNADDT